MLVIVSGEAGGRWAIVRGPDGWALADVPPHAARSTITLDADTAWRLFFKQLSSEQAAARVAVDGDPRLGAAYLSTLAVMA